MSPSEPCQGSLLSERRDHSARGPRLPLLEQTLVADRQVRERAVRVLAQPDNNLVRAFSGAKAAAMARTCILQLSIFCAYSSVSAACSGSAARLRSSAPPSASRSNRIGGRRARRRPPSRRAELGAAATSRSARTCGSRRGTPPGRARPGSSARPPPPPPRSPCGPNASRTPSRRGSATMSAARPR